MDMSKIFGTIYILGLLVNSESVLLLTFVKFMLYSHSTQNCIFSYFLEIKNPCFVTTVLFCPKNNWFYKNLHNSGMTGRRKLSDPSLNRIFNVLSIGVQYMFSFQWTNFGLKCLILVADRDLQQFFFIILP